MALNQRKCILLGMNSLGSVQYFDGGIMLVADRALYLGTNMSATGNQHFELSAWIISTTATLNKLALFWKKAPASTTWKQRAHDAVIASKLLYGLESASLTDAEYARLGAFQIKALRKMLGITHSYHSHISSEVVMETANLRIRLKGGKTIAKMSEQIINRQSKFMAHLMKVGEDDLTKTSAIDHNGIRIYAGHKRTGRPRIKWYDQVLNACFDRLVSLGLLLPNWRDDMRIDEAIHVVLETAADREL